MLLTSTLKQKMWRHQRKASRKLFKDHYTAFFMEQGTGKTLTALYCAGILWKSAKINNVIIVAPKAVLTVWESEISKYLNIPFTLSYDLLNPAEKREKDKLLIGLLNYEKARKYFEPIKNKRPVWDFVIADESHKIKNRQALQSRMTWELGKYAKYRLALSGTPMGNCEIDFFSQFRFINDEIFGKNYKNFDVEFFKPYGFELRKRKLRDSKKELFYSIVNQHCFRITKLECLDLPPINEIEYKIELNSTQREDYDKFKEEKILTLNDEEITAEMAMTLVTKLQQICSGFIYNDEGKAFEYKDNPKIEVVKDLIEQTRGKVIIFCKYTYEVDLLDALIKEPHIVYDGRTKNKDLWKVFTTQPEVKVMITQIRSGGVGLNLQVAQTAIFFSMSYSWIDISQARDRIYRAGQREKVSVYYLIAKDSIEESIYKIIKGKKAGAQAILDDYRRSK